MNTSIANKAMLRFAKEYAEQNGYTEANVKEDRFWGNEADKLMHPDKPQVVLASYAAPVSEEEQAKLGHWKVPRMEIDSYWGHPRIAVVDPEKNFCCLAYDRDTNEFRRPVLAQERAGACSASQGKDRVVYPDDEGRLRYADRTTKAIEYEELTRKHLPQFRRTV